MKKLKVGILGGTGFVGQRFITLLDNHPYFQVVAIAASAKSTTNLMKKLLVVDGSWIFQYLIQLKIL